MDGSLHDKSPVIEQDRAQAGELLASAGSSRTAVEATGNHVAVAGVLTSHRRIHGHDSAMQIADTQSDFLQEGGIVRKNRGHQRPTSSPNHRNEVFGAKVCNQGHYWAKYLDVVNVLRPKPVIA